MSKKKGYSTIDFQITLFTYKLDFQNKNYIYKIKHGFLNFFKKRFIARATIGFQINLSIYKLNSQNKKLYV